MRYVLRAVTVVLLLAGFLGATACGREGPPQPPVIRVAERTRDLVVHQEGTEAVLSWTYPSTTTAGGALPDLECIEIWRLGLPPSSEPHGAAPQQRRLSLQLLTTQGERIARLDRETLERYTRGPKLVFRDDLLAWYKANRDRMPLVLWYAVRSRCCGGRESEFSNIARLVPRTPPEPPPWKGFEVGPGGITLLWEDTGPVLVERQEPDGSWRRLTPEPVTGGDWEDTGVSQGTTWRYRLRAVRGTAPALAIGEPGGVLEVPYPDVYPPPPPGSFVCLPEPGLVRLRWEPAPGAAAYRIFRRRRGGSGWTRLAWDFTGGTAFVDRTPPTGEVAYAIKAVDAAGNESEAATCTTSVVAP